MAMVLKCNRRVLIQYARSLWKGNAIAEVEDNFGHRQRTFLYLQVCA